MPITTVVFDAYGTLFDVAAAARECAAEPGREALAPIWQKLAADWRTKQIEYTWWRAVSDAHTDFWAVTQDGLDYALELNKLDGDAELRERLLALYWHLSAYPEVPAMLAALKADGLTTAVLSNGSPDMLNGAVRSAGLHGVLDELLSVQDVGIFKPHRSVYDLVMSRFDCTPAQVLFVSSNCWDACAAVKQGFVTVWVNRAGLPMERLPWTPNITLRDLTTIPTIARTN